MKTVNELLGDARNAYPKDYLIDNIKCTLSNNFDEISKIYPARKEVCMIAGSAPSFKRTIGQFKKKKGFKIACNEASYMLAKRKIPFDACFLLDAGETLKDRFEYVDGVQYICASHLHKSSFEKIKQNVLIANMYSGDDVVEWFKKEHPEKLLIGGGSTVVLRAIYVGMVLGFREFHLYGVDSSFDNGVQWACPEMIGKKIDNDITHIDVTLKNGDNFKTYKTNIELARQADEFKRIKERFDFNHQAYGHAKITIKAFGSGLIPDLSRALNAQ